MHALWQERVLLQGYPPPVELDAPGRGFIMLPAPVESHGGLKPAELVGDK